MLPFCIILVLLSEICHVQADFKNTSRVIQDTGIRGAKVGENVTLKCSFKGGSVTFVSWYQQSLGRKPHIISTRMTHSTEAKINDVYKERFQVSAKNQEGNNHLTITDVRPSDSATYFCGILEFNAIQFGEGVFLHVESSLSNIQAVVHQPALEPLQRGDSLNLSCTVYAESLCEGEQSLYWFRHGASQPAFMVGSGAQCENLSNEKPHMKNCTSNLTMKSVNSSDTGMYYCALTSCGEIVFGNGTRVDIVDPPVLVYCLSVALAFSTIVLLVLAFVMYKLKKNLCSVCKGSVSHPTCSAASDTTSQDADALHYAALSVNKNREHRHHADTIETECVYSRVRSRKE